MEEDELNLPEPENRSVSDAGVVCPQTPWKESILCMF